MRFRGTTASLRKKSSKAQWEIWRTSTTRLQTIPLISASNVASLLPTHIVRAADLLGNYSSSSYNAGTVDIRRRFRSGLNFQASYTFSKVFTDYSADTISGFQRFLPYLDNAQPGLDRSRANFDLTHAFKANFLYELPFGRGHIRAPTNGFVSQLVSGWTTTSIFTWQSGPPFSILSGEGTLNRNSRSVLLNTAYTTSTPQQIAGQLGTYQSNGEILLINPKFIGPDGRGAPADALTCMPLVPGGFCNPQPGAVGNLPRNAFNGPVFFNWDLGIIKGFPITESRALEFRVEMFNALNHPTFAVGNPNVRGRKSGRQPFRYVCQRSQFWGRHQHGFQSARVIQMGLRFRIFRRDAPKINSQNPQLLSRYAHKKVPSEIGHFTYPNRRNRKRPGVYRQKS